MEFAHKLLNNIKRKIPELQNITLQQMDETTPSLIDYYGYTDADIIPSKYTYSKDKQTRTLVMKATNIYIRIQSEQKESFSNEKIMYILLHEIAHCLTPYVEIKQNRKWEVEYHSRLFYGNLLRVNREAKNIGYQIDKNMLNMKTLERQQRVYLNI
jgi:hypothetical protein